MVAIDAWLFAWIVAHRAAALDGVMTAITAAGRGGLVWIACGVALTIARRIPVSALASLCLAILFASLTADHVLKPLVHRARPFERIPNLAVIGARPDSESFPSGHSANAFAGALVLSRAVPYAAPVWWSLAALVAFSRVYLGVHYPLDVAGGALVGWCCGLLAIAAARQPRLSASSRRRDS